MAEGGSAGRAWRAGLPAVAWAGLIFLVSHQSRPPVQLPPFAYADKVVHAGVFGLLAALVARWLLVTGAAARRTLWLSILAASLYGALDEWHQSFVPGRDPDPLDWAADSAGAVLGAAIAVGLPRRKSRASIRG